MKKRSQKYTRATSPLSGLIAAVLLSAGAIAQAATVHDVEIRFRGGCPVSVSLDLVSLDKSNGDTVRWTSDSGDAYEIYFDPFRGQPHRSNPQGILRSPALDPGIPDNVSYKYTIVGVNCPNSPYDPHIRVY
jgi:hypothetical protein